MKLNDKIYIVASGDAGIGITDPYDCTVYLIDGGSEAVLIDAGVGTNTDLILQNIKKFGFNPHQITRILLTHGHGDHSGGAWELSRACNAQVYAMHETAEYVSKGNLEALSLKEAIQAGVYQKDYQYHACPVLPIKHTEIIQVGDLVITALSTPGHCIGHACYVTSYQEKKILFSGDSCFYGGKIALQSIWDCNLQDYIQTLRLLDQIHPDVLLPSHGCFSMNRGYRHIDKAMSTIHNLGIPCNMIGE